MRKAKITLIGIAFFSVLGTLLAFKAAKRVLIVYFTTTVYNATATKTFTNASTTFQGVGIYRFYTLIDNGKAVLHGWIIKVPED